MRVIRFRRMVQRQGVWQRARSGHWEIAFSEARLLAKLNGDLAEIIMPARPFWIRWLRSLLH